MPFVFVPWPGWDFHGSVTKACKTNLPILDAMLSSLLQDLHDRGLLETTIVTVLGEMGRNRIYKDSAYSGPPGRDHWGTTQFVLVAGGGFRSGMVLGATDRTSLRVIDKYYSPISYGRTLYHLLGIDPDKELYTDERPADQDHLGRCAVDSRNRGVGSRRLRLRRRMAPCEREAASGRRSSIDLTHHDIDRRR